jgi:hypothetical protein
MVSIDRAPVDVMPIEFCRAVLGFMEDKNIRRYHPMTWDKAYSKAIQRHAYKAEDFYDAVWTEDVDKGCSEPYKWHIKIYSYIMEQYWRGGTVEALLITKGDVGVCVRSLDKWEIMEMDENLEEPEVCKGDVWFIHLDDLVDDLEDEDEDSVLEDSEALEAWTAYQNGEPVDDYSQAELKKMEEQVEYYFERQADILRGK